MTFPYLKDPGEVLDFSEDWNASVLAAGEALIDSTWAIEGGDTAATALSIVNGSPASVGGVTSCTVQKGTKGEVYTLVNHVKTNMAAREYERSWTIRIGSR